MASVPYLEDFYPPQPIEDLYDRRLTSVPPPEQAAHGFLTAEQIFGAVAASARYETLVVTHLAPTSATSDISVLASDCPLIDLSVFGPGVPNRVIPASDIGLPPDELPGQLGLGI